MSTPTWYRRVITAGTTGPDVDVVQRKVGGWGTSVYDAATEERVRGMQRREGLKVTGDVDEDTAIALGESATSDLAPLWFHRDLRPGHDGHDVLALRFALGVTGSTHYDDELEQAARRWQSSERFTPTGVIDLVQAKRLGDLPTGPPHN